MSKITELAPADHNRRQLDCRAGQADQTAVLVIIRWKLKATVLQPRRFPAAAEAAARIFAAAVVRLAQIRRNRHL